MSTLAKARRLDKYSLPASGQLEMHVDKVDEFLRFGPPDAVSDGGAAVCRRPEVLSAVRDVLATTFGEAEFLGRPRRDPEAELLPGPEGRLQL